MIELKKTVHTTLRERAYPYTSVRRSAKMYVIGKNKTVTETGNPRNEIIFPALMSETSWKVIYSARRRPRYLYFFIKFIQKFSPPKIKIWFEPMFFSGFFCGFERCGSAAFPNFRGGTSSPPQAAKCVRT